MKKANLSKVAKANAHEQEPPMPVLTARGKRTKFTDMTVEGAVRAVRGEGREDSERKKRAALIHPG